MNQVRAALLAAIVGATPLVADAAPTPFFLNFEKSWNDADGDINGFYNGGTASDGTSGPNVGVGFSNVSGLSNVDPASPFYSHAPSPLGIAFPHAFLPNDTAIMNIANGVSGVLSFFYSSPLPISGAVRAFSGLNGSGVLLGSIDLSANDTSAYDTWTAVNFLFSGVAESFDFTASANVLAIDDIRGGAFAVLPEPAGIALVLVGAAAAITRRRRR